MNDTTAARLAVNVKGELDEIDAVRVFSGLKNMIELVQELLNSYADTAATKIRWAVVELETGSVKTTIAPVHIQPENESAVMQALVLIVNGFAMTEGAADIPEYWTASVTDKARLVATDFAAASPQGTEIAVGGHPAMSVILTERSMQNITAVTTRRRKSIGSVRGTLDTLTVHTRNEASLWTERESSRVTIRFGDADLDAVRSAVKQRVNIHGTVERNYRGVPVSVDLKRIDLLSTIDEGPRMSDAAGVSIGLFDQLDPTNAGRVRGQA